MLNSLRSPFKNIRGIRYVLGSPWWPIINHLEILTTVSRKHGSIKTHFVVQVWTRVHFPRIVNPRKPRKPTKERSKDTSLRRDITVLLSVIFVNVLGSASTSKGYIWRAVESRSMRAQYHGRSARTAPLWAMYGVLNWRSIHQQPQGNMTVDYAAPLPWWFGDLTKFHNALFFILTFT